MRLLLLAFTTKLNIELKSKEVQILHRLLLMTAGELA